MRALMLGALRTRPTSAPPATRTTTARSSTATCRSCSGRGYHRGLKALSFAELYHTGTRKDGYTPEFHHQIIICFTIINLRGIEAIEEECLVCALLHDVMEDYDISFDEMANKFGEPTANRSTS